MEILRFILTVAVAFTCLHLLGKCLIFFIERWF